MRVRSGKVAASVLPPAVGANRIASSPATSGPAAASWSGRSPGQPRELTMWCCTVGARASKPTGPAAPSLAPTESVIAEIEIDVVRIGASSGHGPLRFADGHCVVGAGIEVLELVDAVEDVDELAQEDSRSEPHLGAELPGDGAGEVCDVGIVDAVAQTLGVLTFAGVEVAHPHADLDEGVLSEAEQADLHSPWIVEARIRQEGRVQSLRQRWEAVHAVGSVVERGGAGEDQVETGVPARDRKR